jgi:hypothetical protein
MRTFKLGFAFGLLCLLVIAVPYMATAASVRTESRGLVLELAVNDDAISLAQIEVTCRLTNISSATVDYLIVSDACGFILELLDGNGMAVPIQPEVRGIFVDFDTVQITMLNRGHLKPQASIIFQRRLAELFQISASTSYVLKARWDPGIDSSGNRLPVDRKLVAELKIPAVQEKSAASPMALKVVPAEHTEVKTGASHNFWVIVSVTILSVVVVLGVLVGIARRHK